MKIELLKQAEFEYNLEMMDLCQSDVAYSEEEFYKEEQKIWDRYTALLEEINKLKD